MRAAAEDAAADVTTRPDVAPADRPAPADQQEPADQSSPVLADGGPPPLDAQEPSDAMGATGTSIEVMPAAPEPAAHWPLDEDTGTVVTDASGNGNDGVLRAGATWTSKVFPNAQFANPAALSFDGVSGQVEFTVKNLPALAAAKSVTAWFWTNGLPALGRRNMIALINRAASASLQIGFDLGRLAVWRWSDQGLMLSQASIVSPGWHHLAYVYDGTEHRLYLDGTFLDASALAAPSAPVTSAYLATFDGTEEMFQGRLDDVRIYAQPLSDDMVRALASGLSSL